MNEHPIDTLLAVILVVAAYVVANEHQRMRNRSIIRDRAAAMNRLLSYSAKDFKRRFRMHRWQFDFICNSIRHNIEPDDAGKLQAIRSAGSYVPAELRLAATLRILAGGSYLDASDLFAIAASSIWASTVWPTCEAICNCPELDNIHFPFDDEMKLREHEATFRKTAGRHWPGPGTVAAGDGCAFGVQQPASEQVGGDVHSHHTRKYEWAFGFILFCDAKCNIMSVEATHVSSAHDAEMYGAGKVYEAIRAGRLPAWAHVVMDSAFACTEQELVPWQRGKNGLSKDKDAFNYYLSSQRQCVERVFGILQARWGILWRPLRCDFDKVKFLVIALCRLHNYIIQDSDLASRQTITQLAHEEDTNWKRGEVQGHMVMVLADTTAFGHPMTRTQGCRSDTASRRRCDITAELAQRDAVRPLTSASQQLHRMLREQAAYLAQ